MACGGGSVSAGERVRRVALLAQCPWCRSSSRLLVLLILLQANVTDAAALDAIFAERKYDAVIHFAALKVRRRRSRRALGYGRRRPQLCAASVAAPRLPPLPLPPVTLALPAAAAAATCCFRCCHRQAVGESVAKPLHYYENNIGGLLTVLKVMVTHGVKNIVFSSSATVYGAGSPPCTETSPTGADIQSPYGQTKHMAEVILRDFQKANPDCGVVLLRYFNPVGAHASGTIGEDPAGEWWSP